MPLPIPNLILNHSKFDHWYPGQEQALIDVIEWLTTSPKRFLCASMPTGSGKSLLAVLAHVLGPNINGWPIRTAVLTVTKGLQDQFMDDFGSNVGNVNSGSLIGKSNYYDCPTGDITDNDERVECEGNNHHRDNSNCKYKPILYDCQRSDLVVTNYMCFMYHHPSSREESIGRRNLLICDEAHLAFKAVEGLQSLSITASQVKLLGDDLYMYPKDTMTIEEAFEWLKIIRHRAYKKIKELRDFKKEDQNPSKWNASINIVNHIIEGCKFILRDDNRYEYVIENSHDVFKMTVLWADFEPLFRDIPKILLMSATLDEKTIDRMGIKKEEREWLEVPSYFPKENSPIVHVRGVRINNNTTAAEEQKWVTKIDQIINKRKDRKGIVFGVSYKRCEYLVGASYHSHFMFTNNTKNIYKTVENFKKAPVPAVLVSPSVASGWDFAEDACRYGIVGKIPYPNMGDPVIKARCAQDKDWGAYLAMQTLVQECGRGTRSAEDKCEYLIVDDNWQWFWPRYKHFAPKWFQDRVKSGVVELVPEPMV